MNIDGKVVNWGILGLGKMARRITSAFSEVENAKLFAVGSRTLSNAVSFAAEYNIDRAFGSYEELCQCEEVDVIYVATPHSFHKEHILLALKNNKHVLCEKPFTLNFSEANEVISLAKENSLFIMQAFWIYLMPGIEVLKRLLDEGQIGKVNYIECSIGYNQPFDPAMRSYDPVLGGGALLDIGVYPLGLGMYLFGQPVSVNAFASLSDTGVDAISCYNVLYKNNTLGNFSASIVSKYQGL